MPVSSVLSNVQLRSGAEYMQASAAFGYPPDVRDVVMPPLVYDWYRKRALPCSERNKPTNEKCMLQGSNGNENDWLAKLTPWSYSCQRHVAWHGSSRINGMWRLKRSRN